jgi:hypothetical protein
VPAIPWAGTRAARVSPLDGCMLAELILNLLWACVGAGLIAVYLRRAARPRLSGLIALACVIALLFPIISMTDDRTATPRDSVRRVAVVAAITTVMTLVALARVERERAVARVALVVIHADPRSPPPR